MQCFYSSWKNKCPQDLFSPLENCPVKKPQNYMKFVYAKLNALSNSLLYKKF